MDIFLEKLPFPPLRDISFPTNRNEYKFFSITQKVLEIDVMVYDITKNPKTYKKISLVTDLDN